MLLERQRHCEQSTFSGAAEAGSDEVRQSMLGSIGSRVDTERPGGAAAAQADLTDVPTLAEGDDAYWQRRVALRASGFYVAKGVGQVEVDENSAGTEGNRQAELVGRMLGDSHLGAEGATARPRAGRMARR